MNEICDGGGESSYHYEEIALYCSQYRKLSKEFVNEHLEDIRNLFISNYLKFKEKTGHPCLTVAAHGDFINVKLKLSNSIIVDDRVRKETGILREAYDAAHMNALTCRIADQVERGKFVQKSIDAINRGEPVLELLTHPRQWNSPFWINLKEEFCRLYRELYMKL